MSTSHACRNALFICADPVGEEMAGLGIRNWELARIISELAAVTIAHGGSQAGELDDVRLVPFRPHDPAALRSLIAEADVIVAHPQWPVVMGWLRASRARVIVDLYDPETLETLELLAGRPVFARRQLTATTLDRLHDALLTGHHFMCASGSQRDLWIGAMLGLRFIDPDVYDRDPDLRSVIDVVPFGLPDRAPPNAPDSARMRRELGFEPDDEIVLWNGGIWQWLDAPVAIRALARLRERRPRARLVFMGGAGDHPAARQSAAEAREVAQALGLLGSHVVFNEQWVPYDERGRWLAAADCAVSAAREHLETRFAFRTRILDCLWSGLPVACTTGDELAARVAAEGLGAVAPPGDPDGLATALETILERGRADYADALSAAAEAATWKRAAEPLRHWISLGGSPRRPASAAMLPRPAAQRLREALYTTVGHRVLARRG